MFFMYNMSISIGLVAHTCSTVHHMYEKAHASYILFKRQVGLSLFLFCHAAGEVGLSYQSHFGMLQYQLYVHGSSCTQLIFLGWWGGHGVPNESFKLCSVLKLHPSTVNIFCCNFCPLLIVLIESVWNKCRFTRPGSKD